MREILFRGKDLLGKWIQGDLLQYSNSQILNIVQNHTEAGGQEVVPETVGQYLRKPWDGDTLEIIGNIHDNPELLKGIKNV